MFTLLLTGLLSLALAEGWGGRDVTDAPDPTPETVQGAAPALESAPVEAPELEDLASGAEDLERVGVQQLSLEDASAGAPTLESVGGGLSPQVRGEGISPREVERALQAQWGALMACQAAHAPGQTVEVVLHVVVDDDASISGAWVDGATPDPLADCLIEVAGQLQLPAPEGEVGISAPIWLAPR